MTRVLMIAITAWIALANLGLSNGGTFAISNVRSNGNLQPIQKSKISLDREDLSVVVKGDYADVTVDYRLINQGKPEKVLFGFPVDQLTLGLSYRATDGIEKYRIEDNGNPLPYNQKIEALSEPDPNDLTEKRYSTPSRRNWFLSEIAFARGETKHLRMTYRVRTFGTMSGTSKQAFWTHSERKFSYTFKPAATWGDGKIREMNITIDLSDLEAAGASMVLPPEFKKEGNVWAARHEDFKLATAPDLVLTYDHSKRLLHEEVMAQRLDQKWIESIRASSTHPKRKTSNYSVKNLLDGNIETAWIEGVPGIGIGEWIEITFKKGVRINAIGILNGYCKSEDHLIENGQVLQCRLEFKRDGYPENYLTPIRRTESVSPLKQFPAMTAEWILDSGDASSEIPKVRITITGAEQGQKFADTAISELFICGVPPNEP